MEYGGANSVPVHNSVEERHLRHLVDTINANTAHIPDSRSSNRIKRRAKTRSPPQVESRGSGRAKSPDRLTRSAPTTPAMTDRSIVAGLRSSEVGEKTQEM